jgi:hypothetical protein
MRFILLSFLFVVLGANAQEKNKCSQLPFAVVDVKPELKSDLAKNIENGHPVSFGDKEEHKGTFKVVVDCNGSVQSVMYRDGNYSKQEEVYMFSQLKGTEWKPAILKEKEVSATVFVTVTTKELNSEITIE